VIVRSDHGRAGETNYATRSLVVAAVAQRYEPVGVALVGTHRWLVYRLRG
jgi:hypothetical protein